MNNWRHHEKNRTFTAMSDMTMRKIGVLLNYVL